MLMNTLASLCAGFALNIILGSPPGIFNPENSVPALLMKVEGRMKKSYQDSSEAHRFAGTILIVLVLLLYVALPGALVWLLYEPAPVLSLLLDCYLSWASFSIMHVHSSLGKLSRFLAIGRTDLARTSLAKTIGIRCDDMNEEELIRRGAEAAADCCADNAAGVLFWTAVFGGVGGIFYRTVSILRRTYSVRSAASDDFGTAAHILWTILDFIPAHIGAFLSVGAGNILGLETEDCFDVFRRDRKNLSASALAPCRCVFASSLGITLTPKSVFEDGTVRYLTIGDEEHPAAAEDVFAANELMYATAFFMFLLFAVIKLLLILFVF